MIAVETDSGGVHEKWLPDSFQCVLWIVLCERGGKLANEEANAAAPNDGLRLPRHSTNHNTSPFSCVGDSSRLSTILNTIPRAKAAPASAAITLGVDW
jgi:hypothetical protein